MHAIIARQMGHSGSLPSLSLGLSRELKEGCVKLVGVIPRLKEARYYPP